MSQQINLYSPLFRPKAASLTSANAILCGTVIALVCAALAAVYTDYQLREAQARARVVESAFKEATAKLGQLAAELGKQKPDPRFETEAAALDVQLKGRQEIMDMLKSGVVGNTSGFSENMRAFARRGVSGLWLTGFDIAAGGNELAIQGRAVSADLVATYLRQLNQEQAMQGRKFAAMRISQPPPEVAAPDSPNVAKGAPAAKGQPDASSKPAIARYVEFTISTVEPVENPQQGAKSATEPPPLLGAIDTAAAIDAAQVHARQEAAR